MGEQAWLQLAIQIPVVLVFSGVMYLIIKMFLSHISQSESRSQAFIEQQRIKNDEAVGSFALMTRQSVERLTDTLCEKLDYSTRSIDKLRIENAAHDVFVKTSFKERFGSAVADNAQRSADEEATHMALRIGQERKE
jgi:hypothetical protein